MRRTARREPYRYYDGPQDEGLLPRGLGRLLRSQCMLELSLASLERWSVELYAIREGWLLRAAGPPVSFEEICEEEAECDALHSRRRIALGGVRRALTARARPRGA